MTLQRHNYEALGLPVGPYVHAVSYQGTLFTSGLTAFGTAAQEGTLAEQADAILEQLSVIAEQHKTSLKKLIKVTLFVTDMRDIIALRETLQQHYGDELPASSLIKVDGLFAPELLIEIEATIAV